MQKLPPQQDELRRVRAHQPTERQLQPGGTVKMHPVKRDANTAFQRTAVIPALFERQHVAGDESVRIVLHSEMEGTWTTQITSSVSRRRAG